MTGRRALLVAFVVVTLLVAGCTGPGGDGQRREGAPGPGEATPTETAPADGGTGAPEEGGATADAAGPATATDGTPVAPPDVDVFLNCTLLRVNVTPEAWTYRLYLRYRDTVTGTQRRIAAGFFTGTVTDHFGRTDFVLVAVEVRVTGFAPVLRTRPTRCSE